MLAQLVQEDIARAVDAIDKRIVRRRRAWGACAVMMSPAERSIERSSNGCARAYEPIP